MARPQKSEDEILSCKVTIRLTKAEFDALSNEAQYLGIKVSSLVRKKATGRQIAQLPKAQRTQRIEYARLRALLARQQTSLEGLRAQLDALPNQQTSALLNALGSVCQAYHALHEALCPTSPTRTP